MEGAKVYIQDTNVGWRKATVLAALGNAKYRVRPERWDGDQDDSSTDPLEVDATKVGDGGSLPFQNVPMPEAGYPDMTTLDHLHEAALLHNLRTRFFAGGCPYCYTADIVIAVNPYAWFPELYTEDMRKEYLVFDRSKLPPHVYATSSAAYSGLQETHTDQAILVSGESGAGKTETVKILMSHLAMIASSDDSSHIKRIVESNPLLESFGNAQTVRNDNSSRFGKFIELELNSTCRLVGSRCRTYLLEKSRVVGQDAGERNYHIFYQMLATSESLRAQIGLGSSTMHRDSMRYTRMGGSKTDTIEGKTDAQRFDLTVGALALVGVEGDILIRMLRALAGVLLLGQCEFEGASQDEQAKLTSSAAEHAAAAAAALGVEVSKLEKSLTTRTIRTRNEEFVKPVSADGANATRDALAKELYSKVFDWLVVQICSATAAPASEVKHFVGLLDIFGFESFAINRFEQFCINYANEKLQQKFTHDVFKAVQQEYADEGIPWDNVEFKDNAPLLALVESKLGIIAMLNEECVRPKGSDENFVSKLISVHKADAGFSTPKLGKLRELQFSIAHYAGSVTYTTSGWLERNKDAISNDVVDLMMTSENALIRAVFEASAAAAEASETKKAGADTVATKFRNSLRELMETIGKTNTQYVRCIKPNKNKSPKEVDNIMVVEQLRCAGVIEAIRISRAGFPSRMPLKEFAQRFLVLARVISGSLFGISWENTSKNKAIVAVREVEAATEARAACKSLLPAIGPESETFEVGRTRVYFKAGVLEMLEERRSMALQEAATAISRRFRGRQAQKRFRKISRLILRAQAASRMKKHRVAFLRLKSAAIVVQSRRRAILARRRVETIRRERCVTHLQAARRGAVLRRRFLLKRRAAVKLQALARQRACRRQYLIDLADSKEQAKLENQVKALKAKLEAQERAFAAQKSMTEQNSLGGDGVSGGGGSGGGGLASGGPESSPGGGGGRMSEPPKEILEALQALATENAKLRMELEHFRTENQELKQEIKALKGQSAKSEWFSIMRNNRQSSRSTEREPPHPPHLGATPSTSRGARPEGTPRRQKEKDEEPKKEAKRVTVQLADDINPEGKEDDVLQLFLPLSKYWEDVPCSGLPLLKSGSEVHVKFGDKLLMCDDHGKYLIWRKWMTEKVGYIAEQSFIIEKRAPQRIGGRKSVQHSLEEGMPEDDCLGLAFALRSAKTRKYLTIGGMFQGYRMQLSGERPEDAMVFTFMPLGQSEAEDSPFEEVPAGEFAFGLRQLGESKMLKLRKDGFVTMSSVSDMDKMEKKSSTIASLEYLRPCNSYEIVVHDKMVGLAVSKELPLRVAGFNSMESGSHHVPGPAELTGRVKIGDIICTVNGQDIDGIPRADALRMIACKRPVHLGFKVATEEPRFDMAVRAAASMVSTVSKRLTFT